MIHWLNPTTLEFPPLEEALLEPNGLLAVGGDLSPGRLLTAYRQGIFPWFEDPQPILWWSPDPRAVLFSERFHISRSLRKTQRRGQFNCTVDRAFRQVIHACAQSRAGGAGTWITPRMQEAYCRLHDHGHAHSVECWRNEQLIGGLYGIAIGKIFFGESMFSHCSDASKLAFSHLVEGLRAWDFPLIDCQQDTVHMRGLGAEVITREEFQAIVAAETEHEGIVGPWHTVWPGS